MALIGMEEVVKGLWCETHLNRNSKTAIVRVYGNSIRRY
jgi:hypothetical protein